MPTGGYRVYIDHADYAARVRLVIFQTDGVGDSRAVAKPLEFVPVEEGVLIDQPTLDLHRDHQGLLNALLDALWDFGIRPSNHRDFTNELEATKKHLEDMRLLSLKDKYSPLKGVAL